MMVINIFFINKPSLFFYQPNNLNKRRWLKLYAIVAHLAGIEPATPRLGIWCSILLSYKRLYKCT